VDTSGRAELAWRRATNQMNEEGLRGSPRPSLAVAALLQRQVERLLVRVDSAVDLLEPIRDAQVSQPLPLCTANVCHFA